MKKIVPFTKDIKFNTKIYEITSISLEENYNCTEDTIDGEFIVSGPDVDKLMSRVNLADNESMYYFQKMLANLGIEDALKNAGVQDGDTVRFNDWEFDWYN